jgi:2,3-bisphosphoglycerate-independent phosphoglycerate mutase
LSYAFTDENFSSFQRKFVPKLTVYASLAEYAADLKNVLVIFPPTNLTNVFGEVVAKNGLKQLRIAETEKYAHVTYFINGGGEQLFDGEDRILVQSPKVKTYDLKPEMSIREVTDKLIDALNSGQYSLVICNYANPDMLGHTGNFAATVQALEVVDQCLGRVVEVVKKLGGEMIIISDHGNAEQMIDPVTKEPHTAHTTNPVPFIYIGRKAVVIKEVGKLIDVAATMLSLMGLEIPAEMTGEVLVKLL